MARLTWHGHACFTLESDDGFRIMLDPFLDDNPRSDIRVGDVRELDYILVSHGHHDHFEDAIPLARRTRATVVATTEIVGYCRARGLENLHAMHIGGGSDLPFGRAEMTPALHGGKVAGDTGEYTTTPGGWHVALNRGQRLYHAGDTGLTMDMALLKGRVDVALLPIGDRYTMGPEAAARAVELIEPRVVIPMHYSTWDVIEQDPNAFRERVGDQAEVVILDPGDSYNF